MTSLKSKLLMGLVPVAIFFLLQGALVWFLGSQTTTEVGNTVRQNTVASSKLSELAVQAQQIRRYEKEYFVYVSNQAKRDGYIKDWLGVADKIDQNLNFLSANKEAGLSKAEVAEVGKWKDAANFYGEEMKKIFASVNGRAGEVAAIAAASASASAAEATSKKAVAAASAASAPVPMPVVQFSPIEVNVMIGPGKDRFSGELIKGVDAMGKLKTAQTLGLPAVAQDGFNRLLIAALVSAAMGIALTLVVLATLPKAINAPIEALSASVDAISKGQVGSAATSVKVAEFSKLELSLERLRQSQKIMLERMGRKFE